MANNIITFRTSTAAADIIERRRSEGSNISAWINGLIEHAGGDSKSSYRKTQRIVPMPDKIQEPVDTSRASIWPVGRLNLRLYNEFLNTLHREGLQLYRFPVDADHSFSVISVNKEEASMEFNRYYARASEKDPYVRTFLPLPHILYDIPNRQVIIEEYEEV
jgi:hypothetical protein